MNTQSKRLHEVRMYQANKYEVIRKDVLERPDVKILKDWHKKMMPDYEKAELDKLRDALKRTDKERFLVATSLYKIQQTLNKATITHRPFPDK